MGVLGKILVFVNLVFSLLTAGLIVVVFATRTDWKDKNTKLGQNMNIVRLAADADVEAASAKVAEKEKLLQAANRERKAAEDAKVKIEEELKKAKDDLIAFDKVHGSNAQAMDAATQELTRRKTEVESLQKLLGERDTKIKDIDLQMANLRDQKVQFEILYKSAKEKNAALLAQVDTLTRENAQMKSSLGNIQTAPPQANKPLPPEDVRGTITLIKKDQDLAEISVGSDAGVNVGNELTVYRLRPAPEFLGKITILHTTPTRAVGRLTGPKRNQIKVDDEVAAHVLPGR